LAQKSAEFLLTRRFGIALLTILKAIFKIKKIFSSQVKRRFKQHSHLD